MTSRAAALHHLQGFLDRVPLYQTQRNFDRPGHQDVSRLSSWIRYRVISEEECVRAVLEAHSFEVAEKFVQELMWRTYWKGWLELRPDVWSDYLARLPRLREAHAEDAVYIAALRGETDRTFFNDWVKELVATGYLHNHTRMWFASVWIFTLRLPWQLGAEFMYHHLIDGDPASNTLSWRWVAGLHTKGKFYLAQPDNIAKYSEGRWNPKPSELVSQPEPIPQDDVVTVRPLTSVWQGTLPSGSCVVAHDDDLSVDESSDLSGRGARFGILRRSLDERSEGVRAFVDKIREDARDRMNGAFVDTFDQVEEWVRGCGERTVYAMLPRCGFETPRLETLRVTLQERGLELQFLRRAWDARYFEHARSGYFPFWNSVKKSLRSR